MTSDPSEKKEELEMPFIDHLNFYFEDKDYSVHDDANLPNDLEWKQTILQMMKALQDKRTYNGKQLIRENEFLALYKDYFTRGDNPTCKF